MRFGLLLPHFGESATRERVLHAARRAEELGFDGLWVRDHLIWKPHSFEGRSRTFVEPFVALAAASAVTTHITLGTAVVIPTRWPMKLAQDFASLAWLAGGRVVAGIGLGSDPKEFQANGFDAAQRERIFIETVEICRLVWAQDDASYAGELFSFSGITISPKPPRPIPFQYGGTTPAAVRRAVRYTEGWQVGRVPLRTLDKRLALLRRVEAEEGKRITVSAQPILTIARQYEAAIARVPVREMGASSEGAKWWDPPPSGRYETIADLEGLNVCGTPNQVCAELRKFERRGIDEFIVDLRLQFDDFEEALDLFGEEVLPEFGKRD